MRISEASHQPAHLRPHNCRSGHLRREGRRERRRRRWSCFLFEGIRHPEEVGLAERPRHELDADREVADESGWDCDRGKAENGAQSPIVPKAGGVRNDGLGHDIVGDDSGKVIERRVYQDVNPQVSHQREHQLAQVVLIAQHLGVSEIVGRLADGLHQSTCPSRRHESGEQDVSQ